MLDWSQLGCSHWDNLAYVARLLPSSGKRLQVLVASSMVEDSKELPWFRVP